MPRQWMFICAQLAVLASALVDYVCAAENQYGTISMVGPAFVNREVTLKATPLYPWRCQVEWRYIMEGGTQLQTMHGQNATTYSEDGSFFLKWRASIEYNKSEFYAGCSTNEMIRTRFVPLHLKDIVGTCGALKILSPVVRGTGVELGYFPSDYSIQHQTNTGRTWKNSVTDIEPRAGSYEEKKVSDYLYILTIFSFGEKDEGTYIIKCNSDSYSNSVQLHTPERPSYPVIDGPTSTDFNTTECIYVYVGSDIYCKTNNGTEPVQVVLLLGNDSFVLAEGERKKGLYRFLNVHQHMDGLSRRNVTCQVSNVALETPYEVRGILCNVEKGNPPILTLPEFLDGESSTTICEVRNAIPAPEIVIHVDEVLLADAQQTDSFNRSSHTFTSLAKVTKADKTWNGKEMCCSRKIKYNIGIKDVSVCKHINMKLTVKCYVDDSDAKGRWTLSWKDENSTVMKTCNKTDECLLILYYARDGENTYTCNAWKTNELLKNSLTVISARTDGSQSYETDIHTFRFPVINVLIGAGVICGLCILFVIGRWIYLKRLKVNTTDTVEIVENHSDTSSDNGVLHIATEGVQYAVVHRQAATQRIETQNPQDEECLKYAELDVKFLQAANARVPSWKKNTPTEYAEIEFFSTQGPAVEQPGYHYASV
ncbi:uncharacterized protein LOC128203156 isoform X2 [Mya arenaria]|uniref:uncharacterized protein LOC128203156 isoform X2 n=1 Tax=Mya arenaria TaxID=6604 RepID=UPI0022E5DDC7|nr:uncharacterized protein LOC128203156 isoform X2 [Mya arenaria]